MSATSIQLDPKHLAAKHTGMMICASGVLSRIGTQKGSVSSFDKACLKQLLSHLETMAAAFYAGEISVVDQFLQLYCLDEKRPTQATDQATSRPPELASPSSLESGCGQAS